MKPNAVPFMFLPGVVLVGFAASGWAGGTWALAAWASMVTLGAVVHVLRHVGQKVWGAGSHPSDLPPPTARSHG